MNKYWKAAGIAAIAAGVLYYPVTRLVKYLRERNDETDENEEDTHVMKAFVPAYRGKNKPHHRHPHNGQPGTGMA